MEGFVVRGGRRLEGTLRVDGAKNAVLPLLAACVLAYMELTAVFGMMTGIRHARLDWLNETQAVKQSIGVLTSMLFGMGLVAAMAIPYYVFLFKSFSPLAYMAICTAVMLAAVLLIRQWISTKGVRRYEELA